MQQIKALTPNLAKKNYIQNLVAPPYDIVSLPHARNYLTQHPNAILKVSRPDAINSNNQEAGTYLKNLQNEFYTPPTSACFLLYEISSNFGKQLGLYCLTNALALKKHEQTRRQKLIERMALSEALACQISPIMLCTAPKQKFSKVLSQVHHNTPLLYEVHYQNETHRLYSIENKADIAYIQSAYTNQLTYIADGHHRAQTQLELYKKEPQRFSPYVLSVIFPGETLNILGYHRLINNEKPIDAQVLWHELQKNFEVQKSQTSILPKDHYIFGCYFQKQWYHLKLKDQITSLSAVEILHKLIIEPIFEIKDLRQDHRISFIGGPTALEQMTSNISNNSAKIGFTVSPITVDKIVETADKQQVLPPKSTYFEPKLLDGFLLQPE